LLNRGLSPIIIKEVNQKRKKKYMEIAARNKISLKDVEELAGEKAIEKSEAGSYVKIRDTWKKK
jgi:uncharacterized protein